MKKIISSILLAAVVLSTSGCKEYLDCNTNEDAPDQVQAELYLAGILSAYQGFYWDNRALDPLTQMMGTSGYSSFATQSYTAASDAAGEMWRTTYWLQGMNLENMINQAIEEEKWTLAGIGFAVKAFSWDFIAKYHGEAPLKQAYVPGLLSHDYDHERDIMEQSRAWAEEAIEYLERNDENVYTTLKDIDLAYSGDKSKWIKFAHSIIASDLAALTRKKDFSTAYAEDLINHAKLGITSNADNFTIRRSGEGADAQFSTYNNFWGTNRGNLTNTYWQSDFMVQISTGTVPEYNADGDKVDSENVDGDGNLLDSRFPWKLAEKQIICDTSSATGHYDPRVIAHLSTEDGQYYTDLNDADAIKKYVYYGSGFTGATGPISTAPNIYGFRKATPSVSVEGSGRWIFRDDAPYILLTAAQTKFELAEAYWVLGKKSEALQAWKDAVALDVEFAGSYLNPGAPKEKGKDNDGNTTYEVGGNLPGGSMISKNTYNKLASEYLEGPYVAGITESTLTLSHIMMQKYISLWPWGALEAWTDLRKYHYDINYTGEYPKLDNGWTLASVDQKMDNDPTKVYKGFYLAPAQVENRKSSYNSKNEGSPCYRVRPRYNSEYMWNKKSLAALKPISGMAENYHCSIPWFAYPGEYPTE